MVTSWLSYWPACSMVMMVMKAFRKNMKLIAANDEFAQIRMTANRSLCKEGETMEDETKSAHFPGVIGLTVSVCVFSMRLNNPLRGGLGIWWRRRVGRRGRGLRGRFFL